METVLDFSFQEQELSGPLHPWQTLRRQNWMARYLHGVLSLFPLYFQLLQLVDLDKFGYFLLFSERNLFHRLRF